MICHISKDARGEASPPSTSTNHQDQESHAEGDETDDTVSILDRRPDAAATSPSAARIYDISLHKFHQELGFKPVVVTGIRDIFYPALGEAVTVLLSHGSGISMDVQVDHLARCSLTQKPYQRAQATRKAQ
ncbi:hypothetical protein DACRYDRAFT_17783 [Dacryopinax primogenitus]|uniref:Uncharacterized protein n=1 Tax=Dacryopinax primogenitus (strain DJM 731) TaxID=1858805 RepID=M5FUK5_DACPD|nr:uncharacterized protein DACRYDRAFT_17783 [Dacryopinax primogenitus]EJT99154.1 hypothetical protein DACRYDRAFT_17783 [Dacryopinax primogenitus]